MKRRVPGRAVGSVLDLQARRPEALLEPLGDRLGIGAGAAGEPIGAGVEAAGLDQAGRGEAGAVDQRGRARA